MLCFPVVSGIPVVYHVTYKENKMEILFLVRADYFIKGNSCHFFSEISNQAERSNEGNCSIASELQALVFLWFLECHCSLSSHRTVHAHLLEFILRMKLQSGRAMQKNCTALHVFQSHENRAVMDTTPSLSASFIKFLLNCSFQPACWHCLHPSGSLGPTLGWQRALSCGTCPKWDLGCSQSHAGESNKSGWHSRSWSFFTLPTTYPHYSG